MSSIASLVPEGMVSNRVTEVEAMWGECSHDWGGMVDGFGGISSTIEDVDTYCLTSSVRPKMWIVGVDLGFLVVRFLTTLFFLGFGTIGCDWVSVPTVGISTAIRVVIIGVNIVEPWKCMDWLASPECSSNIAIVYLIANICCSICSTIGCISSLSILFLLLSPASPACDYGFIPPNISTFL